MSETTTQAPNKRMAPKRCESVSPDGSRCGSIVGHEGTHHALYETAMHSYPDWRRE